MLIEEYHEDVWAYKILVVATGLESLTGYQERIWDCWLAGQEMGAAGFHLPFDE